MRAWLVLLITVLFTFFIVVPEPVDARGRGGRGGAGFSRSGGGGSFGSIRNSGSISRGSSFQRSDSRSNYNRSGWSDSNRPQRTQPTYRSSERSRQTTIDQRRATQTGSDAAHRREKYQSLTPEQQQTVQDRRNQLSGDQPVTTPERRQALKDRYDNLTPEQQDTLQERAEERRETRPTDPEDRWEWREENREDWQEYYDQVRQERWNKYNYLYHEYYDDYWHSHWWYHDHYHSSVSISFYINDTPPCSKTVVIANGATYYYCENVWYQPSYTQGEVKYIVISPPPGAEVTYLDNYEVINVGGQSYYVSHHTFHQRIERDGRTLFVVVDPPPGARVMSIPEHSVELEVNGKSYYRYDRIWYQKQELADGYTVVPPPPPPT